jgi:hypothetical protein
MHAVPINCDALELIEIATRIIACVQYLNRLKSSIWLKVLACCGLTGQQQMRGLLSAASAAGPATVDSASSSGMRSRDRR